MSFLKKKNKFLVNPLIISRPEVLSPLRRATELTIATVGWLVWFFLLRPLILVLLWSTGILIFMEHMVDLGGLWGLMELSWFYLTIILIIFLIVRGWNVYNYSKYGNKNRRTSIKTVSDKEIEEYFKMPNSALTRIRQSRDIKVNFMPHYRISFSPLSQITSPPIPGTFKPS